MTIRYSKTIAELPNAEVLQACRADTPLAKGRAIFAEGAATIEQDALNRVPMTPLEMRRYELQVANNILELFGLALS